MRTYNAVAAPEERLRFYGFDMQNTMESVGEGYMWLWYLFPQSAYRPEQTPADQFDAMIYVDHAEPTEVWE